MLQSAPLGRALPLPPLMDGARAERAAEQDLECASAYPTPRPPVAVKQLAARVLTTTTLAKLSIVWGTVSFGLWMFGTAIALVLVKLLPAWGTTPILACGFGGLGLGLVVGLGWIAKRHVDARTLAREGQLVSAVATYRREQHGLGSELGDLLGKPLGESRYCIAFSIGFVRHEVWVGLPSPPGEGEPHQVLVQVGARHALVFDAHGRAHVGELRRV